MYHVPPHITFELRDNFNRREIAEKIIQLIDSNVKGLNPLFIDGEWGSGKSEFCHKLYNLIEAKGCGTPLYINSFMPGHKNDAFMAIVRGIYGLIERESDREAFIESSLRYVKNRTYSEVNIDELSHSFISLDEEANLIRSTIDQKLADRETKDEITQAVRNALIKSEEEIYFLESFKEAYNRRLSAYSESDRAVEEFQKAIKRVATEKNPLIIIIDELDRSEPDFALTTLDLVNDIFDIEHLHFILAGNSAQLIASIENRYGSTVNAENYLDKFIGHRIILTNISDRAPSFADEQFIDYLSETLFKSDDPEEQHCLTALQNALTPAEQELLLGALTLRQHKRIRTFLSLLHRLEPIPDASQLKEGGSPRAFGILLGAIIVATSQNQRIIQQALSACVDRNLLASLLGIEEYWGRLENCCESERSTLEEKFRSLIALMGALDNHTIEGDLLNSALKRTVRTLLLIG